VSNSLPARIQALLANAISLHKKGYLDEARELYEEVVKARPSQVDTLYLLALVSAQSRDFERAVAWLDKAIALQPHNAPFHSDRGNALQALERFDAAVASYDRAIAIKPDFALAFYNRGNALRALKRFDAALDSYDRAIELKPDLAEACYNRGLALQELGRTDDAISSFDRAILIEPDKAEAYVDKSLALLVKGELLAGWELYEWRWKMKNFETQARDFRRPLWLGTEPLENKSIFVHGEQALGDTIQFCRYARLLCERGARVIMEVPGELLGLLRTLEGVSELTASGATLPEFDFHCPMMSLPLAFKTDLESIPRYPAYLRSDRDKAAHWTNALGPKKSLRVGIVWSGSGTHYNPQERSVPLAMMERHLPRRHEYVSLQREVRPADQATLDASPHIRHFGSELVDFTDTAALCDLMDVVVSVDTSVAHLSGALGKTTWILLPFAADWRWLLDRDDSPWYPSVRLYRQHADRGWESVLSRVQADLSSLAG
jgi:tetratricopeptide (TPR) repeat protein